MCLTILLIVLILRIFFSFQVDWRKVISRDEISKIETELVDYVKEVEFLRIFYKVQPCMRTTYLIKNIYILWFHRNKNLF